MHEGTPHGVAGSILDGLADGAKGLVSTITGGVQGVGNSLQSALDGPFKAVGGPEQPLRAVESLLDGIIGSAQNVINAGAVGSLQMAGRGIVKALDHPVEQFGVPPALLSGQGGMGRIPSPEAIFGRSPFGKRR